MDVRAKHNGEAAWSVWLPFYYYYLMWRLHGGFSTWTPRGGINPTRTYTFIENTYSVCVCIFISCLNPSWCEIYMVCHGPATHFLFLPTWHIYAKVTLAQAIQPGAFLCAVWCGPVRSRSGGGQFGVLHIRVHKCDSLIQIHTRRASQTRRNVTDI